MADSIKIGPIDFVVEEVSSLVIDGEVVAAHVDHNQGVIKIEADFNTIVKLISLWHEVIHEILTQGGFSDHDERMIEVLSFGIVDAIKRNSALRGISDGA